MSPCSSCGDDGFTLEPFVPGRFDRKTHLRWPCGCPAGLRWLAAKRADDDDDAHNMTRAYRRWAKYHGRAK